MKTQLSPAGAKRFATVLEETFSWLGHGLLEPSRAEHGLIDLHAELSRQGRGADLLDAQVAAYVADEAIPPSPLPELPICPVHESLLRSGALTPFDNCVACIRVQRDEMRAALVIAEGFIAEELRIRQWSFMPFANGVRHQENAEKALRAVSAAAHDTWPCNDCGKLVPKGDPLCARCQKKVDDAEQWEREHPEARCPPRE